VTISKAAVADGCGTAARRPIGGSSKRTRFHQMAIVSAANLSPCLPSIRKPGPTVLLQAQRRRVGCFRVGAPYALPVSPSPTFRDVWRAASALFREPDEIKGMAPVRIPLMRVVHSRLTDQEAVEQMRPIVQDHRRAAEATLSHQAGIQHRTNGYIPDRAYRIMVAAVRNTWPVAVSPENAALFEREKDLGWLPLEEAFSQLATVVPELRTMAERAAALPPPTDSDGSLTQAYRQMRKDAAKLVGPGSTSQDALVRSSLAQVVVRQYLDAIVRASNARDPQRSLWDLED
jgi:hypothetical protein